MRAYSFHICVARGSSLASCSASASKFVNELVLKSGDPLPPNADGDGKLESCESGAPPPLKRSSERMSEIEGSDSRIGFYALKYVYLPIYIKGFGRV